MLYFKLKVLENNKKLFNKKKYRLNDGFFLKHKKHIQIRSEYIK